MANIQNLAQLADFVKQHPGLSALATSTVAGPLLGLWTHSGAPVPGYGRLLTDSEAHNLPVQYAPKVLPSPNIPPVSIFGHPHTISYSAAPPHLLHQVSSTTTTIGRSQATAAQIFSLTGALTLVVGTAAVVALCTTIFNNWNHKKKSVSDTDLIAFLQLELQKAKTQHETTRKDLIDARDKLFEAQANLSKAGRIVTNNTIALARYRTRKAKLTREKAAHEKEIKHLRCRQEELLDQLGDVQEGTLDVPQARHEREQQNPAMKRHVSALQLEMGLHLAASELEKEDSRYDWSWVQFVTTTREDWYSASRMQALSHKDTVISNLLAEKNALQHDFDLATTNKDAEIARFKQNKEYLLGKLRASAQSNEEKTKHVSTITQEKNELCAQLQLAEQVAQWKGCFVANIQKEKEDLCSRLESLEQAVREKSYELSRLQKRNDDLEEELDVCETVDEFQIKEISTLEVKLNQELMLRKQADQQLEQKTDEIVKLQSQHKAELERITQTITEKVDHGVKLQAGLPEQLKRKDDEIAELRSNRETELQLSTEKGLDQTQVLERKLKDFDIELTRVQQEMQKLQETYEVALDQKDREIQSSRDEGETHCQHAEDVKKEYYQSQQHHQDEIQKLEEQLRIAQHKDSSSVKNTGPGQGEAKPTDETSRASSPSNDKGRSDRLILDAPVKWTSRNQREAWKWAVRVGIVQQGPYPDKQLIPLQLPYADPLYSDLPLAIPKPCDDSYDGEKLECKTCQQTYTRNDLLNHVPLCSVFFSQHAAICEHCHEVFVQNTAFREHEKQCAGPEFGTHPDVLNKLPYIDEFNILGASVCKLPPAPSATDIMQLKMTTLGTIEDKIVVRALLPHTDQDYTLCTLPKPTKQHATLPTGFTGDFYASKKLCHHCKEWYTSGPDFHTHLKICTPFFCGHNTSPAHTRCPHCGAYFRANSAFDQHKTLCRTKASKAPCVFCHQILDYEGPKRDAHSKSCHLNPARVSIALGGNAGSGSTGKMEPTTAQPSAETSSTQTLGVIPPARRPLFLPVYFPPPHVPRAPRIRSRNENQSGNSPPHLSSPSASPGER